jgi:hypothetical protein
VWFVAYLAKQAVLKSLRRHTSVKKVYFSAMPKRGKMNKVWNSGGAAAKGYYGTYLMLFTRKAAILNEILFPESRV